MGVCRICLRPCEDNKRLMDRHFREKAQDIFSLMIDVRKTKTSLVACDMCHIKINKYYDFKHKCRQQEYAFKNATKKSIGFSVVKINVASTFEHNYVDNPDLETVQSEEPPKIKRKMTRPKRSLLRFTKEQLAIRSKKELYEERRKVICEECGKMVQDSRMEAHKNVHLGVKPYACLEPNCKQLFRCLPSLRMHVKRTHANGHYPCDQCGKVLGSKLTLRTHLYSHREKQFKCEICGLMTLNKSRLELHMRVHTQKRDFKCPHCPKSFYVNTVLTLHLRSHSGEKPYVCHVCYAANSHRILYVKHMKKFHPKEEIYKLCDMPKIAAVIKQE
ncbi:zinc finger protein 484-like [Malaya genurostris]|uniref:zinc finger protein 484-like n=1 Tax=Malaya genurostris TaxID=325434 RepID=UPI0026F3C413|nr:zinc finger protein 484-like [Malaya genurostris]